MEAHARGQWPLGATRSCVTPHSSTAERIQTARLLMSKDKSDTFTEDVNDTSRIPLLVDPIDNPLNNVYAIWPERLYIIKGDKILYISKPDDPLLHETAEQKLIDLLA